MSPLLPWGAPNAAYEYKWAISTKGTGCIAEQKRLHKMVDDAEAELRKAKRKAEKRKIQEQLREHFGDTLNDVKKLDFSEGMLD